MARESSPIKRHRGTRDAPDSTSAQRTGVSSVLDVEMLLHNVLGALDAASAASFVEVLARDRQWLGCLQQPLLWDKLAQASFGGLRVVDNDPEVALRNNIFHMEVGESDGETSDGDEEEEVEGAEDEGAEDEGVADEGMMPELILVESAESSDGDAGGDYSADEDVDMAINAVASIAPAVDGVGSAPPASEPAASPLVLSLACVSLKQFLLSAEERTRFQEGVCIVQGDIGEITELGGRPIDAIAFPTTPFLRNPHIGSADIVHRRAGDELKTHIHGLHTVLSVTQVHVTPGFDAGVDKLIHVIGPSAFDSQCYQLLQLTYKNIMLAAQRESLQCLALASISTGNLGVPYKEAARMALRAIQRFLSREKWPGKVGFVCFEPEALDAFMLEKKALVDAFNVVPPYPEPSRDE